MKIITTFSSTNEDFVSHNDNTKYLELLGCGMYDLRDTQHAFVCSRKAGTCKNYMLQILLSGQGSHTVDGVTHTLQAGQCILYKPNQLQDIVHHGVDNPVFVWVHFSGSGVSKIVEDLQLEGIHSLSNLPNVKKLLLQLVSEKRSLLPNNDYLCQSYLLHFLVTLSHCFKENSALTLYSGKITPAINHMLAHYSTQNLSNQDYAQMCYLSESRFSHIFKEVTGTTPKKFLEEKRINAAKELLISSGLQIGKIAQCVGYEDAYYFSRVFKKNVGVSPQTYLKQHKSNS